jgi:hypothetical protein
MKEDVHVRISDEIMSEVRAYAERCKISLAAAVSVLLSLGLDVSRP